MYSSHGCGSLARAAPRTPATGGSPKCAAWRGARLVGGVGGLVDFAFQPGKAAEHTAAAELVEVLLQ